MTGFMISPENYLGIVQLFDNDIKYRFKLTFSDLEY